MAPIVEAQMAIEERKSRGLHGGMNFTFGNPARAANPSLPTERRQLSLRFVVIERHHLFQRCKRTVCGLGREVVDLRRSGEYGALRVEAIELHLQAVGAGEIVFDDKAR